MPQRKHVLVMGYGVMGQFLVEELLGLGYAVDVVCLEQISCSIPFVRFFCADCKDPVFMKKMLMSRHYSAIVDFLMYSTQEFHRAHTLYLENTDHYIFLSSYRVYSSQELPIRETSPQMLDVSLDVEYLAHEDEYSLYKARQERILLSQSRKNFTIVRPSIVYSRQRFPLTYLEARIFLNRTRMGQTVVLPQAAMDVEATMTWGGDAGKMIARLVLNPKAMGQAYSLCTAEYHTWREVAGYYQELLGLRYVTVDTDTFLRFFDNRWDTRYALLYDRCARRILDNSKILEVTGLKQSDLTPLKEGLAREYRMLPEDKWWPMATLDMEVDQRMNDYLKAREG